MARGGAHRIVGGPVSFSSVGLVAQVKAPTAQVADPLAVRHRIGWGSRSSILSKAVLANSSSNVWCQFLSNRSRDGIRANSTAEPKIILSSESSSGTGTKRYSGYLTNQSRRKGGPETPYLVSID